MAATKREVGRLEAMQSGFAMVRPNIYLFIILYLLKRYVSISIFINHVRVLAPSGPGIANFFCCLLSLYFALHTELYLSISVHCTSNWALSPLSLCLTQISIIQQEKRELAGAVRAGKQKVTQAEKEKERLLNDIDDLTEKLEVRDMSWEERDIRTNQLRKRGQVLV